MKMVPVYSPKSESEAAVISSLMQAYAIFFFMRGGAFSSMYPGPIANSLNSQTLMVQHDQVDFAKELLAEFLPDPSSS